MARGRSRLSKLILWELILLFLLGLFFTYGQKIVEIKSLSEVLTNLLPPALMILIVIVITKLFTTVLEPVFKRALKKYISPYHVKNTWQFINYLIWVIAIIILIIILLGILVGEQFNTSIGILIGLIIILFFAISYRFIANFVAWLHIIFNSPLKKGDLIELNGLKGRIAELTTMNIILEEKKQGLKDTDYTGRKISIPNSFIFTKPIVSISSEESVVWDEIKVVLPSNTNYLLAEDIMAEVSKSIVGPIMKKRRKEMQNKMSDAKNVPDIPTTEFSLELNGVLLTVRYFCRLSEKTEVRSAISESILKEFKKRKIEPKFN